MSQMNAAEGGGRAFRSRRLVLVCLVGLAMGLAVGCSRERALPPAQQALLQADEAGVLRLGVYGDPLGLTPGLALGEFGRLVTNLVHAGPLKRGPDGGFLPDLFASFVPTQDEQGNLIVEGAWRTGLRWHDGTPFAARDFEFTLQILAASETNSPYADLARRVTAVQTLDRGRRTRVVFAGNSVQFLDLLTVGVLPSHLLEGQKLEEARLPVTFQRVATPSPPPAEAGSGTTDARLPFAQFPVGLGPYRVVARERAQFVELEAWPGQVASGPAATLPEGRSVPPFQRILVRCHPRVEGLVEDFRAGRLDWMSVPPEIASRLEELRIPDVRFVRTPNPACLVWGFNTRRPPLDRLPVRQALSRVVDRPRLLNTLAVDGVIMAGPPGGERLTASAAAAPEGGPSPADLLTQAGLTDADGDGWRDLDNKPFTLSILTNQMNLGRKAVADRLAADLKTVGIKATVEILSWSDLIGKRLRPGQFDTFLIGLSVPHDRSWTNLWHSSPPVGESLNFTGFTSPALDQALEAWDRVPPGASPTSRLAEVRDILAAQVPVAWLVQTRDVMAFRTRLEGVDPTRLMAEQDLLTWSKGGPASGLASGAVPPAGTLPTPAPAPAVPAPAPDSGSGVGGSSTGPGDGPAAPAPVSSPLPASAPPSADAPVGSGAAVVPAPPGP
ncbi:MAG: hypothetical protein GX442_09365 [Candidatus Riflebacteria bacterium]|nr:hypothetical protein [Candidatus Riflebacteria bacterium]